MRSVLITGFTAFGKYANNPTELLARKLSGKIIAGHEVYAKIIPTNIFPPLPIDYGQGVIGPAMGYRVSAVISFGIASNVGGVRIESRAVNWVENDTYCTPEENRRRIENRLPQDEERTISLSDWNLDKAFAEFKKKNIPFEPAVSTDAGRYCCNALIFRTLRAMEYFRYSVPYIFVHVPCTESCIRTIPDFDPNKTIFTDEQLKDVATILLGAYRDE